MLPQKERAEGVVVADADRAATLVAAVVEKAAVAAAAAAVAMTAADEQAERTGLRRGRRHAERRQTDDHREQAFFSWREVLSETDHGRCRRPDGGLGPNVLATLPAHYEEMRRRSASISRRNLRAECVKKDKLIAGRCRPMNLMKGREKLAHIRARKIQVAAGLSRARHGVEIERRHAPRRHCSTAAAAIAALSVQRFMGG